MLLTKRLSTLLFLLFSLQAMSQHPQMMHFSLEEGLPSSEVHDIHEDRDGYIWMATDHGLCQYNGYEFKTYTQADGLTDNTIFDIREDQQGCLWMTTFSGGISYYHEGRCGAHPANDTILKVLGNNYPDHLQIDEQGNMSMAHSLSNLYVEEIIRVDHNHQVSIDPLKKRFFIRDFTNPSKALLLKMIHEVKGGRLLAENQHNFLELYNGHLVTSGTSIHKVFNDLEKPMVVWELHHNPLAIFEDAANNLWVSTNGAAGLHFFEKGQLNAASHQRFLEGKTITDIIQDREGNYWFSTLEDGVFMMPSLHFKVYGTNSALYHSKITSLANDGLDQVYLSTFEGKIYLLDTAMQQTEIETRKIAPNFEFLVHSNSNIYMTNGYHISNKKVVMPNIERPTSAKTVYERKDGTIIKGLSKGVLIQENRTQLHFLPDPQKKLKYVLAIYEEGEDLWLGTLNGMFIYEADTIRNLGDTNPLFQHRVTKIIPNKYDFLFVATKGAGILILHPQHPETIHQLTTQDGLNSNFIRTLFIDQDSILWVGTNKGLNKVLLGGPTKTKMQVLESYHRFDGLPSEEINHIIRAQGLIWLATNRGLTYFDPQKIRPYQSLPRLRYTELKINDSPWSLRPPLQLASHQNDLSIHFLGLNMRNGQGNRYRYQLAGYQENWIETSSREIKYTNLPPGDYQLKLSAANSNAQWLEGYETLDLTIRKHYTQEYWFRILIVLLGIILLWLLIQSLLRRQKAQVDLQRQTIESEQKALRAQINPHFIFNAMNSIQYFITDNDKRNASIYLSRFSRLMRKTLEDSKKNLITLEEELHNLERYLQLEQLRFPDKFEYQLNVKDNLDLFETEIPPMIIQPFLENAIWHGLMPNREKVGHLNVCFTAKSQYILCTITDDGIGRSASASRKKDKQHRSTGIKNSQERIQLLNKLFKVKMRLEIEDLYADEQAIGTKVLVYFPIFHYQR